MKKFLIALCSIILLTAANKNCDDIECHKNNIEEYKKEIIDFVCTEDFKFIYNIKKHKEVLTMFFNEDIINKLYK